MTEENMIGAPRPDIVEGSTPGPYRRTRRKFGRWRRRVADPNNLSGRLDKQRAQLEQQAKHIAELKATVAGLKATATALGKRMHPVELASNHRELEHGRLAIQVGVCEARMGKIEEQSRGEQFAGGEAEHAEARSLVEEVRREHEQVRVRMQVIGQYEERLRRMEDAVVKLYDGDVRHPF
jgi:chromosome segregation ATPase